MSEDELPEGWVSAPLGELLEPGGLFDGPFGSNLKTSDYTESGVRVVRLENLTNLRFIEEKRAFISKQKYEGLRKHTVVEGDLLFGSFLDDAVRVAMLPALDTPAIAKADCFCIRPRAALVMPRYLMFYLGANRTKDALLEEIHGATRPRVTTRQLRQLEILVPPLAEQKRIVAKVEELLAHANAARERLARVPAILKRFRQAVLAAACEGRLSEGWRRASAISRDGQSGDGPLPAGWRRTSLELVSERITKGSTPTSYGHKFQTTGIRFVKIENIRGGRIDGASIKDFITKEAHLSQQRSILEAGDVLFSIAGTIGATCVVKADDLPANTNQALAIIRGTSKSMISGFLRMALEIASTAALDDSARGVGMNNISLADVRDFEIPVPPLNEQRVILRRVEALFKLADAIEKRIAAATARAEKLTQAILAKAFRGELVATEAKLARRERRGCETASRLLERVQEQPAGALGAGLRPAIRVKTK